MHVWLGDILDHYRDIIVPCTNRLVVTRRHEPSVLINEGNGIDGTQVLVVFLHNLARAEIVLRQSKRREIRQPPPGMHAFAKTYLDNLLVRHTGKEHMLLVLVRVKLDDIRNLSIRKRLNTLTWDKNVVSNRAIVICAGPTHLFRYPTA